MPRTYSTHQQYSNRFVSKSHLPKVPVKRDRWSSERPFFENRPRSIHLREGRGIKTKLDQRVDKTQPVTDRAGEVRSSKIAREKDPYDEREQALHEIQQEEALEQTALLKEHDFLRAKRDQLIERGIEPDLSLQPARWLSQEQLKRELVKLEGKRVLISQVGDGFDDVSIGNIDMTGSEAATDSDGNANISLKSGYKGEYGDFSTSAARVDIFVLDDKSL